MLEKLDYWLKGRGFLSRTGYVLLFIAGFLTATSFYTGAQVLMFAPAFVIALFLYSFFDVILKRRLIEAAWTADKNGITLDIVFRKNFDFSFFYLAIKEGKSVRILTPESGLFFSAPKDHGQLLLLLQGRLDIFRVRLPIAPLPENLALKIQRTDPADGDIYFILRPLEDGDDAQRIDAVQSARHNSWYVREAVIDTPESPEKTTVNADQILLHGSSAIVGRTDVALGAWVEWSMIFIALLAVLIQWSDIVYLVAALLTLALVFIWRRLLHWPLADNKTKVTIVLILFVATLMRGFIQDETIISFAHFLILLAIVKHLFAREPRDTFIYVFLVLFVFVALALFPLGGWFFVLFSLFLLQAIALFSLYAAGKFHEDYRASFGRPKTARSYFVMNAIIISLTFGLFFALPHSNRAQDSSLLENTAPAKVRFTESGSLGSIRDIKQDYSKQIIVEHVQTPDLAWLQRLYWRGMRFDRFDGRSWQNDGHYFLPFENVDDSGMKTRSLRVKTYLNGENYLFSPASPLRSAGAEIMAVANDPSILRFQQIQYFPQELKFTFLADAETGIRDAYKPNKHDVPPVPADIEEMMLPFWNTIPADFRTNPVRLTRYIREGAGFSYSLADPASDISSFLYEKKQGYCEFFATVLAVTLQHFGFPATMVSGYSGGEWNDAADAWVIRGANAHSWVEIPDSSGTARIILDPTPDNEESFFAFADIDEVKWGISLYDAFELKWLDYVTGFTGERQKAFFMNLLRKGPVICIILLLVSGSYFVRRFARDWLLPVWRRSPGERFIRWLSKAAGVDAFVLHSLESEYPELVKKTRELLYHQQGNSVQISALKREWCSQLASRPRMNTQLPAAEKS